LDFSRTIIFVLDRTRSHKFVNAFASSSSVFVFVGVVICVFLLIGEFCYSFG
jgi:hypothetical protein